MTDQNKPTPEPLYAIFAAIVAVGLYLIGCLAVLAVACVIVKWIFF